MEIDCLEEDYGSCWSGLPNRFSEATSDPIG
jgi:hypothetical protein